MDRARLEVLSQRLSAKYTPATPATKASRKSRRDPARVDYREVDKLLIAEMYAMILGGKARNATDAARALAGRASGSGKDASKVTRLAAGYIKESGAPLHPVVSSRGVGLDTTERTSCVEFIYLDIPQCRWTPAQRGIRKMTTKSLHIDPLAVPIPEAVRLSGISRSELYRRLATGHIRAVKSGARTLVLMDSLRAHLTSLPPATFRAPKVA